METIILQPRNEQELAFVTEFVKRTKLKAKFVEADKKRRKEEILNGIELGMKQVEMHLRGELELPTIEEFLNGN